MAKWTKQYIDIENVNSGNQFEDGDHMTKEAINTALNNTASNKTILTTEITTRENAVNDLTTKLNTEISDRQNADNRKVDKETNKGLVYQLMQSGLDLNTLVVSGFYYCQGGWTNGPSDIANTNYVNLIVNGGQSSDYTGGLTQIATSVDLKTSYTRTRASGKWSPWLRTDVQPALYNLGAYDSIDFNNDGTATITRQTGYWNSENATILSSGAYTNGYRIEYKKVFNIDSDSDVGKSNWTYNFSSISGPNDTNANSVCIFDEKPYIFVVGKFALNDSLAYISNNPVSIQYKLSTSYTEKVILNQPLLDLPQEGTQWLREEWEKGLNLLQEDFLMYNPDTSTANKYYTFRLGYVELKANKTYYLSLSDYVPGSRVVLEDGTIFFNNYSFVKQGAITPTKNFNGLIILQGTYTSADVFTWAMLNKGSHALPYQPYKGELIRQSSLENQVPMLGNQGNNKVMLGCRGQYYNSTGSTQYIYLAKWDDSGEYANDSGIHIRGIIGGFMFNRQSIIDVVASYREGYTFNGYVSQKQDFMNIVITDACKVYLVMYNNQYCNYTIDIQCGNNGTITYTGDVLTSVDGSIVANMNDSINVQFPYFPLNGGLKANTSATDWGVSTGSEVASFNDTTGGSFKFRRDCPSSGQMSLVIDGNVYVNEGQDKVLTSADVSNKLDADATSITNAQGEWFTSESGHIDFGTSTNQTRIYSSDRPQWYKYGINQGEIALKSDTMPEDVADYGVSSVKVDAGHLYIFSIYIEDDGKFYTSFIYIPNNYSNACRSNVIATFGNYKYLVTCGQRSNASVQGTLTIEKQLIDGSGGTRTNSYFNKVFKMF